MKLNMHVRVRPPLGILRWGYPTSITHFVVAVMVVAVAALVAVQIQTTPEHNWHNPRNMSHVLTSY